MSFSFRKYTAILVLCALLGNIFILSPIQNTYAAPDTDGSANIDLFIIPTVPASSLIGTNFTYNVSLENKNTSDGDGYRPGFILSLPAGVNLVDAGTLGTPVRTVTHNSGSTLYFFETNQIALKGTTVQYPFTLASTNAAGVFVTKNIGILAYVDDSIYGRGAAPSGSPPATLTGGIDFAAGSGVSMPDTTNLTFPDNITNTSNLSILPFVTPQTQFVPFDVRKTEEEKELIGIPFSTTLHVIGNSMGPLGHFHLQDVIPSNRGFSGIISVVGGTVGGTNITYDAPTAGSVTIDFTDISVPTSGEIQITYETVPLAYDAQNYSGGIPVLDTGSVIPHKDPSPNTVTMHTGGLALTGGPYPLSTWNNGLTDIVVNSQSIVPPRTTMVYNRYANLSKSSDIASAVIGDTVTYTLNLKTAKNAAFTTNGSGSYIEDILPDGLTFSGTLSSLITDGTGTPLTFISASPNVDGDTTVIWRLNSGFIGANSTAEIVYQAILDAAFEGAGNTEYENTEILINDASFYGTVGDGSLSGIWGMTDPSIVDTSIYINATNSDNATATVSAPIPSMKKQLISITLPNGSVYDYNTGFPAYIAPGSALRFALTMDFPRVNFINPKIIDALPLLAGPNTSAYDIDFQTNPSLKDIYNSGVLFNTNDGVTPASDFNGLNLSGSSIPNAAWIATTPANNLEFQLNSGVGNKTFAILFTVDVLPTKPAGGISTSGLVPLTNYAYSTYNDDSGTPLLLPVMDIPFTVNFPSVSVQKTASGGTNVEAGKDIQYSIILTNTGSVPAFLENIVDTLPANMDFITGSIMASGALSPLSESSMIQSGNTLSISFDTGSTSTNRSFIPTDNSGTPTIRENTIRITYTIRPNTNFVIAGGATRTNTVSLDYYASSGALSNSVNNLGPVTASANVTVKSPSIVRSLLSTSETDSTSNNLYVGEEVVYRTEITVPNGTFNLASYTESINANLQFLTGTVITYSGSLTFSSGTTFSAATVNFGTLTNSDTDSTTPETIVIDTTYRVLKNATAGTNYNNNGTFTYSSTSTASSIAVNVRKPTITLTKLVSPTTADAGDVVTYTITANNTSTTADAYDIHITDILPSYLTYVTGSLLPGSYSGASSDLFTSSGGGNGVTLDRILASSGASLSFQAILNTTVQPANSYTNRADVIYDTLDDDNSPYEWSGGTSATAVVNVPDITLTHTISSTSLVDTTSALFSGSLVDVALGERVFYTTTLGFPEGFATGVTLTQTLPSTMKFLSGYILFDGVTSHTLSNISISPDNIITFTLGDIDNTGIGAGTGITVVTEAVMLDNPANTAGSIKTSTMLANYSEKSKSVNTFVEVVEPSLSVVKDYSPNTGDGGDTIPVSITVTNTSLVHAYDVVLTDIPPSKLTPGVGFSGTINIGTLSPGQSVNYTYDSIINISVNPGEILTGTASVVYTTYPGLPTEGERSYSAVDNDFINIITPGSIALDLLTTSDVSIGNISQYEIRIPVGEGLTNILSVSSLLPEGMAIIPSSVVITPDASITYSGSVVPVATPDSDTILAASTQTVVYTFTGVNNSNVDNGTTEYITIRYDAVTLNSTDNNNGNTKNHTVTVLYDGSNTKSGSSLPIVIREPNVILNVSNTYAYNTTVPYVFTLTNTGTATAYNLDLSTLIPPGVSYTGNISITNSGGAVNLSRVGDTFIIDSLPVNSGNPLIFTINGAVSESVPNFTNLTLTGTVIYTSEAGAHVAQTSNPLDTERTSGGGVDDYIDANKTTSFILNIPLLDESIGVSDVNGGDGIIGDIFEYTITLTNTGNVALTAIPVTLDIPTGFTGFMMISTPPGSTDVSTSTGGVNNAGYLSLSGINIAIGATVTIVYRVQALTTVNPGTTITTTAQVGNSFEGALGGSPNVPVLINAPKFISSAVETDINGGNMLRNERILHVLILTNTGTATGTNISVTIPWSRSGSTYVSGTLLFQSGTMSDTGSVLVDEILGRITFTIPSMPPGSEETYRFQTLTTGPIGATITTNFTADSDEGVGTTAVSNILTIVDDTPGGGGAPIGGNLPPSTIIPNIVVQPPKVNLPTSVSKSKKTSKKTPVIHKNPIDAEYEKYLALKKRLAAIVAEENTAGTKNFVSPKILPQTGKTILERVKKLVNAKLSLDVPKFEKGDDSLDSYLKNLPLDDQYRDEYVVLPSNGMIAPINTLEKELPDYKKLISGREIDVNKYLKTGVMSYPGTNANGYGGVGNPVIFGHSSYYKNDSGRYKTHFQKIIELEQNEEVWIYKKQGEANYKRYRYAVTESYEIKPSNVKILDPGIGKNLTLFTCTPIGGIAGRWVIQAKFIDEEKIQIETSLYGTNIMPKEKKSIKSYFQGIEKLSKDEKKSKLLDKYNELIGSENTDMNKYFRMQIAKMYKEL